jgi:hypothetical protein
MKKVFLFLFISISLFACKKDKILVEDKNSDGQGSYEVYVDGDLVSKDNPKSLGLIGDWLSTGNQTDFSISIFGVPEVGNTVTVDYETYVNNPGDEPEVEISGDILVPILGSLGNFTFYTGTVKRVSKYRIEFSGTIKEELIEGTEHSCTGFVEVGLITNL